MGKKRIARYVLLFNNVTKFKRLMNDVFLLMVCLIVISCLLFEFNTPVLIFTALAVGLYLVYWFGISGRMEEKRELVLKAESIKDAACSLICIGITVQAITYYKEKTPQESLAVFLIPVMASYILFCMICWIGYGRKISISSLKELRQKGKSPVFLEIIGIIISLAIPVILFQENYEQTFMEPPVLIFSTGSSLMLMFLSAEAAGLYKSIKSCKSITKKGKEKADAKGGDMLHLAKE